MVTNGKTGLSREYVMRSILHLLEKAELAEKWGTIEITLQDGRPRVIKYSYTIKTEGKIIE